MNREVQESGTARPESDVESGFVATNGVRTYYERQGSGPAIVFVHGFLMDTRMWAPQVEALADDYTVVTYDVRGHGQTGRSDEPRYDAELLAADLDALVTALDLDRPVVCGLSMGGMIAQAYAARYPEKLSGLVLSDTFTPGALPVGGGLAMPHLLLFSALSHVVGYKRLNAVQIWVGERLAPGMVGNAEFHEGLVEDGPTMAGSEFRKGIGAILRFTKRDFDAAAIRVPTVVLVGEHEPAPMKRMANHLAERIEGAEFAVVPDAGHGSSWDNPAFFTDAVRTLVERSR
ncbi:alpha/beta fold hydrolase [Halorarius litoreus]|uniref:alpha/beta fold hydrolase n=1 Tax=Halorarius litoreus TaxID=2962676 RepID=UPI0020CDE8C4|nr:alpha/beta hydrolase [Halorarius litoreus]